MKAASAIPDSLKTIWLFIAPGAFLLAVRILWEKTVLTWQEGPQMVGFSLMHRYPALAMIGLLCTCALLFWSIPAVVYGIVRRKQLSFVDFLMTVSAVVVLLVVIIPDTFFARVRVVLH